MRTVLKEESGALLAELRSCVFIYPTDTIYGIGCNALDEKLVEEIRLLKGREQSPFSVIAPSKQWIREHCVLGEKEEQWLAQLPGPYTLILRLKQKKSVAKNVTQGKETLGVRIPAHWIAQFTARLGVPIITTSANISGQPHMRALSDIPEAWEKDVKYVFYEGELHANPSTLVDLTSAEVQIRKR